MLSDRVVLEECRPSCFSVRQPASDIGRQHGKQRDIGLCGHFSRDGHRATQTDTDITATWRNDCQELSTVHSQKFFRIRTTLHFLQLPSEHRVKSPLSEADQEATKRGSGRVSRPN
ncbi:hypothetical protein CEXT_46481 [Caerostris extrusa]|uniref:Uncharacterized protein n=1 Tax=Caerostris extrusa TaxID=172846 RepID=A0AAV4MS86_CAEEX|nr:hypothetical protein CEXT_46481 [Caerostris extrusa]